MLYEVITRKNVYGGLKQKFTQLIAWETKRQTKKQYINPVDIVITWHCKDKKRDKDNIAAGAKFVLDGLVTSGLIQNDTWELVNTIQHKYIHDKRGWKVVVEIAEVENYGETNSKRIASTQ